jgi:4-amino-4-deoxy-L-arabinose transferase-like glycosyltransferase
MQAGARVMTAQVANLEAPAAPADTAWIRKHAGVLLWLASGAVLFAGLGVAPVTRTQEARVQETAREMLGAGRQQWLIPKVNGRVRMQKPPLAYWLTAASFKVFSVGEGAGRVPAALAGWLTIGLTAATAAWLFNRRAGFFAGAALLGSYLFFRNGRLAETDVLAMLFVTAAVYAMWRGYRAAAPDAAPDTAHSARGRPALWFHAAALAMALALLAKGPPAAYPLIFLAGLAAVERRWRVLWRFFISGAPLTLLVVAAPWFAYVAMDPTVRQLTADLRNSAAGGGHSGFFLSYFPQVLVATAPWSGLVVVSLVAAGRRWRQDHRMRGLLVWTGAIFVPLCAWGNKQSHYLMPLLPPLMVLVGWVIDEALSSAREARLAGVVKLVLFVTAALVVLGAPALIIAARQLRGHVLAGDVALAALMVATVAVAAWLYRRRGFAPATAGLGIGGAVLVALLVGVFAPSLNPLNARSVAHQIRARYGDGPYVFMGKEDLPMCFHMRSVIEVARNRQQLYQLAAANSGTIVIEPLGDDRRPPSPAVVEQMRFEDAEDLYRVGVPLLPAPDSNTEPAAAAAQPSDD